MSTSNWKGKGKGKAAAQKGEFEPSTWGRSHDLPPHAEGHQTGESSRRSRKTRPQTQYEEHAPRLEMPPPIRLSEGRGGSVMLGHNELRRRALPEEPPAFHRSTLGSRGDGDDGNDADEEGYMGVVVPLKLTGSGSYDAIYTVSVDVGPEDRKQTVALQVDSGSSDLWIVSTACGSKLCEQAKGYMYDATASTPTGSDFTIKYLVGDVSGPIVWDQLILGGYQIPSQAICAATSVNNEPLGSQFSGILGLALQLNSVIAASLPPTTGNTPDGATTVSNIFGTTPLVDAPAAHFISMSLERPDASPVMYPEGSGIPSLMGVGRHPESLVPDPSKITYSTVVSDTSGVLFWKANIQGITVYHNGERNEIPLGRSVKGGVFPTAVVDSGVPIIVTTSEIANSIYGAIDVHPGADGQYYVPCSTPLNITINLDDREEIPLHPLDLTAMPPTDNNAAYCIGLIQTADTAFKAQGSNIGDMILGVPFMRNVYTVMAYEAPVNGSFTPYDPNIISQTKRVTPRLGLLPLTNATVALEEFNTVRILNRALGPSSSGGGSVVDEGGISDGKKLSVGIQVLIAICCFFALCFVLFGIRWFVGRRRWKKNSRAMAALDKDHGFDGKNGNIYVLARRENETLLGGHTLRDPTGTKPVYLKERTISDGTLTGSMADVNEFGLYKALGPKMTDPWEPAATADSEWEAGRDTLVGESAKKSAHSPLSLPERTTSSSLVDSPTGLDSPSPIAGTAGHRARKPSLGQRALSALSRSSFAKDTPSPLGQGGQDRANSYFGRDSWIDDSTRRDDIPEPVLEPWQEFGSATVEAPPPIVQQRSGSRQRDRSHSPEIRRSTYTPELSSRNAYSPDLRDHHQHQPHHHRTSSSNASAPSAPLLAHTRDISDELVLADAEFGGRRGSMAGVGTARGGSSKLNRSGGGL